MNRWLVAAGAVLISLGLAWPWLARLPLGRLPGDLHVQRGSWDVYFPVTSSILISIVLTLLLWWWRR